MKSGQCCLLISIVIVIGLGICGYIYKDEIIHGYNSYWNAGSSGAPESDVDIDYVEETTKVSETITEMIQPDPETTSSTTTSTTEAVITTSATEPTTTRLTSTEETTSKHFVHEVEDDYYDNVKSDEYESIDDNPEPTTSTTTFTPPTTTSSHPQETTRTLDEREGSGDDEDSLPGYPVLERDFPKVNKTAGPQGPSDDEDFEYGDYEGSGLMR